MCVEGLRILKIFCKLKISAKSQKLSLIKNAFENALKTYKSIVNLMF